MNYRELIIEIKKDEATIKNLVKNIKREVQNTKSFDEKYEAKMKIMQKEYTDACVRMNKIKKIYEKNTTETELCCSIQW